LAHGITAWRQAARIDGKRPPEPCVAALLAGSGGRCHPFFIGFAFSFFLFQAPASAAPSFCRIGNHSNKEQA
jgi:hypothetical protein